mmetsp:Transcript_19399/g.42373  ORF Transcript_19399/g.42373 Transcript_19399/m.42373 type:complete len:332 (+) Transcript_19399:64-1059(+)|eukprot:CAMPEP_0170646450 /NCGR_PEP_ID=MMETSP0224-20130122/43645_1 /TAXON_ID=285029 /ORGANISM="Togula jolla, Strain CCCM 725" /LENGTH=331 /DNA_ID=CAMNT_0010977785 /DNA_START=53 /DNA_END=1048 /DNA_ORIENTATION=-
MASSKPEEVRKEEEVSKGGYPTAPAPAAPKAEIAKANDAHGKSTAMAGDNFQFALGTPTTGFSLFLAERTKKIHFIRHAEGYHNVETAKTGSNSCLIAKTDPQKHRLWDAKLTPKGIAQAEELREYLTKRPSGGRSFTSFDLIVVSPLTRTLETALHIFGRPRQPGVPAFLDDGKAPVNSPEHRDGVFVPAPRMLVREECRERWGEYVCDGRRPIREIIKEFENFDFSELSYDDDVFWSDKREPDDDCCARALAFLEWLNKRPEKCIAVVTHSSFLRHLFSQFGGSLAQDDKETLQRLAGNCELRSVVMCSHGIAETRMPKPMTPPSTVVL